MPWGRWIFLTESTISTRSGSVDIRIGKTIGVTGPGYAGKGFIINVERGDA